MDRTAPAAAPWISQVLSRHHGDRRAQRRRHKRSHCHEKFIESIIYISEELGSFSQPFIWRLTQGGFVRVTFEVIFKHSIFTGTQIWPWFIFFSFRLLNLANKLMAQLAVEFVVSGQSPPKGKDLFCFLSSVRHQWLQMQYLSYDRRQLVL